MLLNVSTFFRFSQHAIDTLSIGYLQGIYREILVVNYEGDDRLRLLKVRTLRR